MTSALVEAQEIEIWFDGSAVDGPPVSLGAGWIRVVDGKLVDPCRQQKITDTPPTSNKSLFAELVCATLALKSVPGGKDIIMHGDHGHVIDFLNKPQISKKIRVGEPRLAEYFKRLEAAMQKHHSVRAVQCGYIKGPFDVAVHNLAASAAGSRKQLFHPELPGILGEPAVST